MTGPRTLVGRMAALQIATMTVALTAVLAVSFTVVVKIISRTRDRALMNVATATVTALSELSDDSSSKRIGRELDQHRPSGVRVEAIDERGGGVAAAGEGPRLRPAGDDSCVDQEGWRVCERAVGGLRVLVGRSRRDDDAITSRFITILALVSGVVLVLGGVVSRAAAARGLKPLAVIAERLARVRPGSGDRIGAQAGAVEVDLLADRFNELLQRIEEAFARERRFAAQASHELRTPLTVLRAELEELANEAAPSHAGVLRAAASAENLVRLVESLLLFGRSEARFDPGDLDVVNLADVVRRSAAGLNAQTPGRIVLHLPDEVMVLGHETLLGRAVGNLLDNALKYAPDSAVAVTLDVFDNQARMRVSDRGPGIGHEMRDRIFEPFFREPRARAQHTGHGLGLPLARAVARGHGGDVDLIITETTGTTFRLCLPVMRS